MLRLLAIVLLVAASVAAHAQSAPWPERPIKLIVPTGAGSATDIMARLLASDVSARIGGSVFVENVAGGSGVPAHQAAARAQADGYTFLFTNTSGLAINPVTFKQLPYDPVKDFTAVALVTDLSPQMVSVHRDTPAQTLPQLVDWVRNNPGKVSYAVDATAGAAVFYGRMLNRRAGLDMAEVPYRSAAQMVQDAAAGRVQVLVSSIAVAQPHVETGALHRVALFSSRRFPTLPDLPTVAETLSGASHDGWFVVVAPAGAPREAVERMNKAIVAFLELPDTQQRLHKIGLDSGRRGDAAWTQEYLRSEQANWRALAQELGIQAQ
ncbi:MAG TPA: tripartite tricarboxylate transporter substrate-binding protein [Beijerinckiaceae bacterium]|jgi:tripartite-type tricarboxylate transporter receptor subunit TctC